MSDSDSLDLTQFYEVFFDEAAEHLAEMESLLLRIDVTAPDGEEVNAIFRVAHSIKGGAATFGFRDITDLTHEMETVFDRVRKNEMPLSTALVDIFLASGDRLKSLLDDRRAGGTGAPPEATADLRERLQVFLVNPAAAVQPAVQPMVQAAASVAAAQSPAPVAAAPAGAKVLELVFGPIDNRLSLADVDSTVNDLKDFGRCEALPVAGDTERRYRITTEVSQDDLRDALAFMVDPDHVKVLAVEAAPATPVPAAVATVAATPAVETKAPADEGFGFFVDEATLPAATAKPSVAAPAAATATPVAPAAPAQGASAAKAPAANAETSIRVSVEKVDQLINLVGELVITQAMLSESAAGADPVLYERLQGGLAQLERNTRSLQEAAMSIRMMPMSFVFSRFPRVVRDLAAKLGKQVELKTVGENTELDKGLIERIVDPLTHLVRNSLDHGIESPDEREAGGKPRKGTITLSAYHQGGNIVIDVADDGKGLRRDKILAKARERGLHAPDEMTDSEVWNLIFEAGFSTAEVVTDVSGRGVGMDVVRRNIKDMGGRVEIDSAAGHGTRMTIRLPLTLAILDGMSVRVGREIYILPLACVAESMMPSAGTIRTLTGSDRVISVRGDYLPVLSLNEILSVPGDSKSADDSILVIIETEGNRVALQVDELVGQHQVVIKSLEANYRKVPGVSGATIMGDGRVALILDAGHIAGQGRQRLARAA